MKEEPNGLSHGRAHCRIESNHKLRDVVLRNGGGVEIICVVVPVCILNAPETLQIDAHCGGRQRLFMRGKSCV